MRRGTGHVYHLTAALSFLVSILASRTYPIKEQQIMIQQPYEEISQKESISNRPRDVGARNGIILTLQLSFLIMLMCVPPTPVD